MPTKAIFFDRDGVVNAKLDNNYVKTITEFVFENGFFNLFSQLKLQNYLLILVTNQQCIGKGIITAAELDTIHNYMETELKRATGHSFDAIYYCPDLASSNSPNRKPAPGMFNAAINRFNINAATSWTIGDSITDIMAGQKAGTKTILLNANLAAKLRQQNNVDWHELGLAAPPDAVLEHTNSVLAWWKANKTKSEEQKNEK